MAKMGIHKEGLVSIMVAAMLAVGVIIADYYLLSALPYVQIALSLASLGFLGVVVYFFRIDERPVQADDKNIISVADGKVVAIEPVKEHEYFGGKEMLQISVFMSVTNMHANWWPVSGEVMYSQHHNGKFRVAWHPKSSTENERAVVVVKNKKGQELLVKQIAGAMARRVVTYDTQKLAKQGEQMGFIKFGSRIDLIVPLDVEVKVKINDVVRATETVLAQW